MARVSRTRLSLLPPVQKGGQVSNARCSMLNARIIFAYNVLRDSINLGAKSKVKSSAQRALRTKIQDTYAPLLTPAILDEMIPKKSQIDAVKL